jgi:hypothetical protein
VAGQVKRLIELVIQKRSAGNTSIVCTTRAKLILKGINPERYNEHSEDDPEMISKIRRVAKELGVTV